MRPASLFVIVVYAFVLFGGISDVNGGFLKDLLKFGKKGVDQAGEAIEEAGSSSNALAHDDQAHNPAFLRNQLRPPAASEADRLAIMYPYHEKTFSEQQEQVWAFMNKQEALLQSLVKAYRKDVSVLDNTNDKRFMETCRRLLQESRRLSPMVTERKSAGPAIGPLDDMPQLVPASQSLHSAWKILENTRPLSRQEVLAQTSDLYILVVKIEQSLSAALEQYWVYQELAMVFRKGGSDIAMGFVWHGYENAHDHLRLQASSLYEAIDAPRDGSAGGRLTMYSNFLRLLNFPRLEEVAKTRDVGKEDWNEGWMTELQKVESQAAEAKRRLMNLEAGRKEDDNGPRGIRTL